MCGLFGVVQYGKGNNKAANVKMLVQKLAIGSAVRGTHATGLAYVNSKKELVIDKAPESAYKFKGPDQVPAASRTIMGHTRHTTQGSEKKNYNNHPFLGYANGKPFAFAHNGVLDNDYELKKEWDLPVTQIETDSYVGVQLIERQKRLNMESVKWMAERVEGMFCFTIVDHKQQLWIIKNDSPMNIVHFPKLEMYVYASTADILHEALLGFSTTRTLILDILRGKKQAAEEVEYIDIAPGEIFLFKQDGTIEKDKFTPLDRVSKYQNRWLKQQANGGSAASSRFSDDWKNDWYADSAGTWHYDRNSSTRGTTALSLATPPPQQRTLVSGDTDAWYMDYMKGYALSLGYDEGLVERLREKGVRFDEIEDAMYSDRVKELCLEREVAEAPPTV